ncbi:MAG: NAD(P)H-dependent oxidoreductase [Patescibacteria group bacterium]|nr:NAD(P)H-dependent oxidoreductase [Patescibacteria group bacterium]
MPSGYGGANPSPPTIKIQNSPKENLRLPTGQAKIKRQIKFDMTKEIFELLKKVDCHVPGSPTYWCSLSGLMKNFINRLNTQAEAKTIG